MFIKSDRVRYRGNKFLASFKKDGITFGEIIKEIENEPGMYVVEFGDDAYIMPATSLEKWKPSQQDLKEGRLEPEVSVRRKRYTDENEPETDRETKKRNQRLLPS